MLVGELLEKAQQLFPDGAAGKHLDPAAQMQGLFREQLEEVRYDLTVAGTGIFAPLGDLVVAHEDYAAILAALDERAAVAKAGERQLFAEDAAFLQRFEHGAVAVRMQAQKRGTSGEQHADHILLLTAGEDRLPGSEALLIGAEAAQHVFARRFVHAGKQRRITAVHRSPSCRAALTLSVQRSC